MFALKNFEFSDLILAGSRADSWFFKGTAAGGFRLLAAETCFQNEPALENELATLWQELSEAYSTQKPGMALRVKFNGITFRAARYEDVAHGQVFFLRRLPEKVPDFLSLGLPSHVTKWLLKPENSMGLLLFSGAQGSGKTTSAAAFIAARLASLGGHGVSYENPVEMPLSGPHGPQGFCFQAEISSEGELPAHIERSHRYSSPDIIYIGEIRSKHAASEALRVALGSRRQLVVATIHGIRATAALDRLLTWARELDGEVARQNLAQTLVGVIQQEMTYSNEKRVLNVPEFLLLPFNASAEPVRAKLRDGNLFLDDNIREQKNRIVYGGEL